MVQMFLCPPIPVITMHVREHNCVQAGKLIDGQGRVLPPLRDKSMAQICVLPAVQKVRIGQYDHVAIRDQESRIADKCESPLRHEGLVPDDRVINHSEVSLASKLKRAGSAHSLPTTRRSSFMRQRRAQSSGRSSAGDSRPGALAFTCRRPPEQVRRRHGDRLTALTNPILAA